MRVLIAALSLALSALPAAGQNPTRNPAQDAISGPDGGGWMLLQYFYPGPTLGRGLDYWISARDYGAGPGTDGVVRVRVVQPSQYDDALEPALIMDGVRDVDCINRRERPVEAGTAGDWQVLPDFVPGSQMIFSLCSPAYMASRDLQPDLAAALARSRELERLHRAKEAAGHY